jgi:hypothetical protein
MQGSKPAVAPCLTRGWAFLAKRGKLVFPKSQAPDQVRGDGGERAEIGLRISKADSPLPPTNAPFREAPQSPKRVLSYIPNDLLYSLYVLFRFALSCRNHSHPPNFTKVT